MKVIENMKNIYYMFNFFIKVVLINICMFKYY